MRKLARAIVLSNHGNAGVEFALIAPLLILLLGGVVDFALAFWTRGLLSGSVAQGIEYAFVAGPGVSQSSIKNIVGQNLSLPNSAITVTGPGCLCVSGTPATSTNQTCGNPCADGSTPGVYVTITANYNYPSIFAYGQLANAALIETTTARIK